MYGTGRSAAVGGKWRAGKYLIPAKCETWAAYMIASREDDIKNLDKFVVMFHEKMKEKGMQMLQPAEFRVS